MPCKAIVRPPSIPDAPPDSPVPAPRGTIGTRCSRGEPDELDDLGRRRRAERPRSGRPGVEVGGLVVAVGLAVERRRSAAGRPGRRLAIAIASGSAAAASVGGSIGGGHAPQSTRRGAIGRAGPSLADRTDRGWLSGLADRGWPIPLADRTGRSGYATSMPRRASLHRGRDPRGRRSPSPPPIVPSAAAIAAADELSPGRRRVAPPDQPGASRAADIVPGSVGGRASPSTATYDAYLQIYWGPGLLVGRLDGHDPQHLGRGDRPARAQHHRGPPRQHAIYQPVTVDGATVQPTISDQTILVPLGGILAGGGVDAGPGHATGRRCGAASPARTGCSPRPTASSTLYRWLPWISRRIAVRPPEPRRPVRDRRPARASGSRSSPDRRLVLRDDRRSDRVSADGLVQTFEASNVRDFTVTAAHRLPDAVARPSAASIVRVWYRPGLPAPRCSMPRRTPSPALRHCSGPYPYRDFKVAQIGRRLRDGIAGPDLDPDRAPATCATSSPTRRPTSGSTGSSATTRRASRSPTRPPPTSSPATSSGLRRASAAARPPGST